MNDIRIWGALLVAVSVILICGSLLRKNESYFNLRSVIRRHFGLFKDCKFQYSVFYGFPLLLSVGLAMIYETTNAFFSELNGILSILVSILLAILRILCGYDYSSVADERQKKNAKTVLRDRVNAIIFTAVLSVFLLLYGLVFSVVSMDSFNEWLFDATMTKRIVSGMAYYIFTVILLNLLLIIKHMSKLIEFNLYAPKKEK